VTDAQQVKLLPFILRARLPADFEPDSDLNRELAPRCIVRLMDTKSKKEHVAE